ncbi:hypothetical protein B0H14DRAFT_329233 [Mycena olivaceomarginata]|nr:hypothetical protein B0H14DRAFT_329233 [Mycena olivaceomarginata]
MQSSLKYPAPQHAYAPYPVSASCTPRRRRLRVRGASLHHSSSSSPRTNCPRSRNRICRCLRRWCWGRTGWGRCKRIPRCRRRCLRLRYRKIKMRGKNELNAGQNQTQRRRTQPRWQFRIRGRSWSQVCCLLSFVSLSCVFFCSDGEWKGRLLQVLGFTPRRGRKF